MFLLAVFYDLQAPGAQLFVCIAYMFDCLLVCFKILLPLVSLRHMLFLILFSCQMMMVLARLTLSQQHASRENRFWM
jgi:hypothetical protein